MNASHDNIMNDGSTRDVKSNDSDYAQKSSCQYRNVKLPSITFLKASHKGPHIYAPPQFLVDFDVIVMGGGQSVPKITKQDRAILESVNIACTLMTYSNSISIVSSYNGTK